MKLCQSNGRADTIASVLGQAMNAKIKVAFEILSGSKPEQKPKPRGAKASQKTIDDAANTPAIKTILTELEANIIDVEDNGQ